MTMKLAYRQGFLMKKQYTGSGWLRIEETAAVTTYTSLFIFYLYNGGIHNVPVLSCWFRTKDGE